MFKERCINEAGYPRLGGSEALIAVPLARYFLDRTVIHIPGVQVMQQEIEALRAMRDAALAVQAVERLVISTASALRSSPTYKLQSHT